MTTSRRASAEARKHAQSFAPPDRLVILNVYLARKSPMAADEVAQRLGWKAERVRRRVTELKQDGKLEESGEFAKTAEGRNQAVMRVPLKTGQQEFAL